MQDPNQDHCQVVAPRSLQAVDASGNLPMKEQKAATLQDAASLPSRPNDEELGASVPTSTFKICNQPAEACPLKDSFALESEDDHKTESTQGQTMLVEPGESDEMKFTSEASMTSALSAQSFEQGQPPSLSSHCPPCPPCRPGEDRIMTSEAVKEEAEDERPLGSPSFSPAGGACRREQHAQPVPPAAEKDQPEIEFGIFTPIPTSKTSDLRKRSLPFVPSQFREEVPGHLRENGATESLSKLIAKAEAHDRGIFAPELQKEAELQGNELRKTISKLAEAPAGFDVITEDGHHLAQASAQVHPAPEPKRKDWLEAIDAQAKIASKEEDLASSKPNPLKISPWGLDRTGAAAELGTAGDKRTPHPHARGQPDLAVFPLRSNPLLNVESNLAGAPSSSKLQESTSQQPELSVEGVGSLKRLHLAVQIRSLEEKSACSEVAKEAPASNAHHQQADVAQEAEPAEAVLTVPAASQSTTSDEQSEPLLDGGTLADKVVDSLIVHRQRMERAHELSSQLYSQNCSGLPPPTVHSQFHGSKTESLNPEAKDDMPSMSQPVIISKKGGLEKKVRFDLENNQVHNYPVCDQDADSGSILEDEPTVDERLEEPGASLILEEPNGEALGHASSREPQEATVEERDIEEGDMCSQQTSSSDSCIGPSTKAKFKQLEEVAAELSQEIRNLKANTCSQETVSQASSIPSEVLDNLRAPTRDPLREHPGLSDSLDKRLATDEIEPHQSQVTATDAESVSEAEAPTSQPSKKSSGKPKIFKRPSRAPKMSKASQASQASSASNATSIISSDTFKSYRTNDSKASCLFVTQLKKKLETQKLKKVPFHEKRKDDEQEGPMTADDLVPPVAPRRQRQKKFGDLKSMIENNELRVLLNTSAIYRAFIQDQNVAGQAGAKHRPSMPRRNGKKNYCKFNLFFDRDIGLKDVEELEGSDHLIQAHTDEDYMTDPQVMRNTKRICEKDMKELILDLSRNPKKLPESTYNFRYQKAFHTKRHHENPELTSCESESSSRDRQFFRIGLLDSKGSRLASDSESKESAY